jgi:hypothetical protein
MPLVSRLQQSRVRDACGETGPLAQNRARVTYYSVVSVALLLSAFESAAAPASWIWLLFRLQRGSGMLVAGQGRWRRAGRARLT